MLNDEVEIGAAGGIDKFGPITCRIPLYFNLKQAASQIGLKIICSNKAYVEYPCYVSNSNYI